MWENQHGKERGLYNQMRGRGRVTLYHANTALKPTHKIKQIKMKSQTDYLFSKPVLICPTLWFN